MYLSFLLDCYQAIDHEGKLHLISVIMNYSISAFSYIQTIQMIFNDLRALYQLILCFYAVFSHTLSHFNWQATNVGLCRVPGRL